MKQLALDLKNGNISLLDCPDPVVGKGELLITGVCSLVSPGTERMLLDFGSGNWFSKARQQPEKLKQTFQKLKTDGWRATFRAVQGKLSQPMPLGYCHVGRVAAVGAGVTGFKTGDRVVSNGHHAARVTVPQNLVAKIPGEVSDEAAAFTVPGTIALQSIRLLQPTFGETILVVGAGLIGQLTARLLQANGCRVFVTDKHETRLRLLPGNIRAVAATGKLADAFSGIDGVILTATATDKTLLNQCAAICRKRGRIILSGVVPVQFDRSLLYEKEISFQVSCSYGPGRYDAAYEKQGLDYPIGFVRWTAQRNFEAVLEALRQGQLNVDGLISLQAPIEEAPAVYRQLQQQDGAFLTALFTYPQEENNKQQPPKLLTDDLPGGSKIAIAGAGQFTAGVILPILSELRAPITTIAGKGGFHAASLAKKYSIPRAVAGFDALLEDPEAGLVLIATPHQFHAGMAAAAMRAGKDVFLEKPMATDRAGLSQIIAARTETNRLVYVGYNRRFAPLAIKLKKLLRDLPQPPWIIYTVNAGKLPEQHWLQDEQETGGRLLGEVCHFVDFCVFLQGTPVTSVWAKADEGRNTAVIVSFENGAQAVINYFSDGNNAYPKERIEVHGGGRSLVLDNWRKLEGYGLRASSDLFRSQDKGHKAQFSELLASWPDRKELIPFHELVNVASATLAVKESIAEGREVTV